MVPADDEHKSVNEAEKNTSTQKNFVEKLKFWKRCKQEDDKPARLTPMPPCLMKWWVPFGLAGLLLIICTPIAFWWGGHFHWPSSAAMTLCATIVGTGFAFSAWQQKSHDNVVNAKQAQATVEREDYWKRREHIFHLLDSKNPGLRLGAVALLAELADQAAHSTFLNDIEKIQLQRHIIDTLCLQLRHEGLSLNNEGNASDHAHIQAAIFETILKRIDIQRNRSLYADWSKETINITYCMIHTPVHIKNLSTHATLDLSKSHFYEMLEFDNVNIPTLLWEDTHFSKELITLNNSSIGITSLPQFAPFCRHINTTFITNTDTVEIRLRSYATHHTESAIIISNCKFASKFRKGADVTSIRITMLDNESNNNKNPGQNLYIQQCQFMSITITATNIHSKITIAENRIAGNLRINLAKEMRDGQIIERTAHSCGYIRLRRNTIYTRRDHTPIVIINDTDAEITNLIRFYNNFIVRDNDSEAFHKLDHKIFIDTPKPFLFLERTAAGEVAHQWKTGGRFEDLTPDLRFDPHDFFKEDNH